MDKVVKGDRTYFPRRYTRSVIIYFEEGLAYNFRRKFEHKKRTRQFPFFKNLVSFLELNPSISLYFSEEETHRPFVVVDNEYYVHIDSYTDFCKRIESSTEGRAKAFFGQHIDHSSLLTSQVRRDVIESASVADLLEAFKKFDEPTKKAVVEGLAEMGATQPATLTTSQFGKQIEESVKSGPKRKLIISTYPQVQLETLKEHRQFLASNLDKNETFIQNWVDAKIDNVGKPLELSREEAAKLRKSRCLIFGLEYINHKREGRTSQKRFDILTKIAEGQNEYVLIELKSPSGHVFDVDSTKNQNDGISETYSLSDDVSRAIPQITNYRGLLREATATEWQGIGLPRGQVVKCIILVGTRIKDNPVWDEHYLNLKQGLSSSIEIMTYSDLLEKLDVTIRNLEENL
jgi:hypothetical protein